MKYLKILFILVVLSWLFMLSGCGMSGSGSTTPNPAPTPDMSVPVITAFSINGSAGVITGKRIAVTLPFGTNVTSLIATFTAPGSTLSIKSIPQINGVSKNDFTHPIVYTVTKFGVNAAASAKTSNTSPSTTYTVTVTVASISAKAITAFSLGNSGSASQTPGIITLQNISVKVPFGTNVKELIATFTTSGVSVAVNGVPQVNGVTQNDFTNPVTYTVTAADGTTQNYTVTVLVAAASGNDILEFSLNGTPGVISAGGLAQDIVVKMPYGTNLNGLVARFITTGVKVSIHEVTQVSGTTQNDFTKSVVYTVTAADGAIHTYTVIVTVSAISSKFIDSYSFGTISGVITGQHIAVTVPFGTNVTALIATFTTTGENVTVGGIDQTSTVTPHDFTNPVTYTVIAADGTTADYTVTVTVASASAHAITAFAFGTTDGIITGQNITVTLPFGTDVTDLIAHFSTTGVKVSVGTTSQVSGTTRNNFINPVSYVVTAADGNTSTYIVTVTVAPASAKAITSFSVAGTPGVITGFNIAVTVPFGTNINNIGAEFTTTGASVYVNGVPQFSGTTSNNFTTPVTYVVTAADGTTQNYLVTVIIASASAKSITEFSINGYEGRIEGLAIAVNVQYGTNLTDLIATFTTTGRTVSIDGEPQNSGDLPSNNFSGPVIYTVEAADGTTQNYTVTVTATANVWTWMSGGSTANQFGFYGEKGTATPDNVPGNREASISWVDSSGNLWLFGGQGYSFGFSYGAWNDLWKYNILSGEWTWVSGAKSQNQPGTYGEKGTASVDYVPGSRIYSTSWIDSSGNLWLFGGDVQDNSNSGVMNDLWKFNPETTEWTWLSGDENRYAMGIYSGPDSVPGAREGSVSWIDASGNMWLFGGKGIDSNNSEGVLNDLWKYDPLSNKWTWVSGSDTVGQSGEYGEKGTPSTSNIPGARQNSISWVDKSGNLWLFGGLAPGGGGGEGEGASNYFNDLWKFNPETMEWTWASGSEQPNQLGIYGNQGIPSIDNMPGSRAYSTSWIDTSGNLWLYGGYFFYPELGIRYFNDLWKYNPATGLWTWVNGLEQYDEYGIYGSIGVPSASNRPGGRRESISWTDASGDLWLFGGYGYSIDNQGDLNDLWRYHP